MCEFLSGYVLKNGDIFCDPENADSHTEMLESNNIKDNGAAYYHQNVCRWEFTPNDITKASEESNWTLQCDESVRPDWWVKHCEKVHTYAWQRIKSMIIKNFRDTLLGGCWILDGRKAEVKKIYGGRIVAVINGAGLVNTYIIGTDMHKAYLRGADLTNTKFRNGANLNYIDAEKAIFTGASIQDTILTNAQMSGVVMRNAYIYQSILSGSNLAGAKMDKTRISSSVLNCVDFERADMTNAVFNSCNMQFNSTTVKTGNTQLRNCDAPKWLTNQIRQQLEGTNKKKAAA